MSTEGTVTLEYKIFEGVPIQLDVYAPTSGSIESSSNSVAAVVWFHGGGLTFGNRTTFFPRWLQRRMNDAGIAFISADYRLIPTGSMTAHHIIEDVQDVFAFLRGPAFQFSLDELDAIGNLPFPKFRIDPDGIAVGGSSAGGACAYFAAMHVNPKPAAVLSMFAMGGDCLAPHYFTPKTKPFLTGRPLLNASRSKDYLFPLSPSVSSDIVSDSPMAFHPPTATLPALPANPRMPLALLYLQLGTYLDYYSGEHTPSLSATLRAAAAIEPDPDTRKTKLQALIPQKHRAIFPQLGVDSSWPPTLLIHGSEDTSVPVGESKAMYKLLQSAGVMSRLTVVEGYDHFFDQDPKAEEVHGTVFDDVAGFFERRIRHALQRSTLVSSDPVTLTYKTFRDVPIKLDVYPPTSASTASSETAAVLWFHGGGLTFANRTNFFPNWLQKRVNNLGIAFISADYRLIPTGSITAHHIIEDVQDAFAFLRGPGFRAGLDSLAIKGKLPFRKFFIDPKRIAVGGSSAGGTCAYFAAMHVNPKPAAVFSMFGMGGDCLNPHYYEPKTQPFLTGRPLLDPSRSKDYIYPLSPSVASDIVSDSPLAFHPPTATLPALPANPRMPLALLYLQLGTYLDYYTGEHTPSLSAALRAAATAEPDAKARKAKLLSLIPSKHRLLFSQLGVNASWPPTLLVHGSEDTAVPVAESKRMYELLQKAGVMSRLRVIEGRDHFFDQEPNADSKEKYGKVFDDVAGFFKRRLSVSGR